MCLALLPCDSAVNNAVMLMLLRKSQLFCQAPIMDLSSPQFYNYLLLTFPFYHTDVTRNWIIWSFQSTQYTTQLLQFSY